MRKNGFLVYWSMCFFLFFTLGMFTLVTQSSGADVITWQCQSYYTTKTVEKQRNAFAHKVKEKSNGRLDIKTYPANQLVKTMAVLDAVSKGALEMGWGAGIYHRGKIPEAALEFGLPLSWQTWEEQKELFYERGIIDKVRKAYAENGIYYLSPLPAGYYILMTKSRLDSLADLKGLKIRAAGVEGKILSSFGATMVSIPGSEQYMALQRGTIDGTVHVALALIGHKLNEVVDYVYYPPFHKVCMDIFINQKAWNSLTPDLQKAVQESIEELHDDWNRTYDEEDALGLMRCLIDGSLKAVIYFPDEDVAKLRRAAMLEWDKLAAKNERCKEMVEIYKQFMRDKGRL
jgi:TRAP-type mannitol/chloroaromatic compound transport system substrate-binding protein